MADRPDPAYEGDEPHFFVSYAHDDSALAYPEMAWLQQAGFNLWYDDGIHVGSVWRQALADALSKSAGMIFLASKHSVESNNCMKELNFILDEDKPVFVVQLDETPLPSLLKLSLSDRQMLAKNELDDATYRTRLVDALSTVMPPSPRAADEAPPSIPTKVPSIALQPLTSGGDDLAFWAESFVDDLATLLIHRTFRIVTTPNASRDQTEVGRELDVAYVLSGTVRSGGGERLRVSLRLTDATSGTQVWGERYDDEGDPLDVTDRVTREAAIEISEAVMDDQSRRVRDAADDSLDAWGLCARAFGMTMNTIKQRDEIIRLLRLAVDRDPSYALAHSMLGSWLCLSVMTLFSRNPDEDIEQALHHTDESLALAPNNPVIMQGAAWTHRIFGNEPLALDLAQRANAAGGADAMFGGRYIGNQLYACLLQRGRVEEATELMLQVKPAPERMLCLAYLVSGEPEKALEWAQQGAATAPDLYLAWVELANALGHLDRLDEAREAIEKVKRLVPTFKIAYYEKGTRISWRNREAAIEPQIAGLRKLDID
ncbi:MAG: TIR domain-containing protein [Gammaproteobacteria bacterium]|nr:TIR domain-containing protein [Gammaproteobacteria bacterium]